jgi:hypothetical protein
MEIKTLRNRVLVGAFATVMIVGSGVATALVTSADHPTTNETADTSSSTSATVDTNPDDSVPTTTPSTTGGTTGTTLPDHASEPDPSSAARYSGPECGDGDTTNHGQYVSSQPKGGESRSAAAQSDCGKPVSSVGGSDDADDTDDAPDTDVPEPGAPPNPGSGHGNSANAPGHNK